MKEYFDINHNGITDGVTITLRSYRDKLPEVIFRVASNQSTQPVVEKIRTEVLVGDIRFSYESEVPSLVTESDLDYAINFLSKEYQGLRNKGYVYPDTPELYKLIAEGNTLEEKKKIFFSVFGEANLKIIKPNKKENKNVTIN